MYHNREHAKAAFKHHTLYLNLGWMDNDRQRVINSLYLYSLAKFKQEKCREITTPTTDFMNSVDRYKKPRIDNNFPVNALSNKSSLGVAVALPLYKQCKVKRVEKLFLGILNKSTRCYLDLYEFEIKKLLKTECKKLHSLGYDNFEVRSLIYNTHFLPKRVVNSIVRHSGKTKYSVNVPKFILYRDFIDSPSISYVLENNAVSDFFYHSSVFSRGMPTKKNKTTLSNQLDISRLQGKKIKTNDNFQVLKPASSRADA